MSATTAIVERNDAVRTHASTEIPDDTHAALFVWGFWALLTAQALFCLYLYGCKTPYLEDWHFIAPITGQRQPTWSWFWEQAGGDHRIPVLRALFYLDFKLLGIDVRPILYLNLALFVVLAAGMIWAARRVRGVTTFSDAFFPILLLTTGHAEVLMFAQTYVYIATTFLAGAILIIQMACGPRLKPGPALAAGLCLVFLPLTYSGGVAFAPFLGLWMAYTGYHLLKSSDPVDRRAGYICLLSTLAAFLIVAGYVTGYHRHRIDYQEDVTSVRIGPVEVVKTILKFLAISLGPWARRPAYPFSAILVVAMLLVCAACLATSLRRREPGRRSTAVGLSLYLMAYLVLALAMGVARASWGRDSLLYPRFAVVSAPLMFGVYFIWECCGPARWIGLGRMILFTIVACNLSLSNNIGAESTWRKEESLQFERGVRNGVSIPRLVSKYARATNHHQDELEAWLKDLRNSKIGNYRFLPPDPKFREIRLRLTPVAVHNVQWDGRAGRATGERPFLVFDLEKPEFVCGLRIRYSSTNEEGFNPYFEVFMHEPERPPGLGIDKYMQRNLPTGREIDVPVWIYKTIDRIRVHPDKRPCDFTISEIVLLLPDSDSERIPSDEYASEKAREKHDDFADPSDLRY
jgi:hypothetical protein